MKFEPIKVFTDDAQRIDVHDDPPGLWGRVVCVSGWQSAKIARKRWRHASAVGPLRTVEGIDLLVRSLLANPQIRLVVIGGPTAGPIGERTFAALRELWVDGGRPGLIEPELFGVVTLITSCLSLADEADGRLALGLGNIPDTDRPGGRIVLPPPPPKVEAAAPHGDPGQRVTGRTLAEVWPRALEVAMRFGRTVPTHYGMTREYIGLTSVIRDPLATIAELETNDARTRASRVVDGVLRGGGPRDHAHRAEPSVADPVRDDGSDHAGRWWDGSVGGVEEGAERPRLEEAAHGLVDQFETINKLLDKAPDTRAAYLSPWRSGVDAGQESGRPCLVGIWFRATPAESWTPDRRPGDRGYLEPPPGPVVPTLHAVAAFRSHDLNKGYPLNAAALCLLLRDTAERHGMAIGTLTIHSYSAHIYSSGWNAAEEVIKANPGPVISWDPRSVAVVETYDTDEPIKTTCDAYVDRRPAGQGPHVEDFSSRSCRAPATRQLVQREHNATRRGYLYCDAHDHQPADFHGPPPEYVPLPKVKEIRVIFRVACFTPDGGPDAAGPVIGIIEGKTASEVALKIKRSGLAQEPGHLLWIGIELAKAEAKL